MGRTVWTVNDSESTKQTPGAQTPRRSGGGPMKKRQAPDKDHILTDLPPERATQIAKIL